jgi:hypothetical protein
MGRIKSILVWSLFDEIVGGLIREIEGRLGFFGRIVMGLIGLAWSVACVFVIGPEEEYSAFAQALKKSLF